MQHQNRINFFAEHFGKKQCTGIELGVAAGTFSSQMLSVCENLTLYSVDAWAGDSGHDANQMATAKRQLQKFGNRSIVIQNFFEEVLSDFEQEFFDFIYIDGYAHTGQNDGQTLRSWIPKLKKKGIFSGHDYDPAWQPTIKQVDAFAEEYNFKINVIEDNPFSSWYIIND